VKARLSQVHWRLVLATAVLVYLVTFIVGLALSVPLLAILNRGLVNPQSALQVSSVVSTLLVLAVTGYGAFWAARRVEREALLHGFLVGLMVALLSFALDLLFAGAIEPLGMRFYVLMVAAGWLGGLSGGRWGVARS
jgi:putative membrane protein (TIGR04086 family)